MPLLAGVSIIDITPAKGLELAGYPHYPRNNTGVHDPLYASCLYIDNGRTKAAIIGLDILFYSRKHVIKVRRRISEALGIPEANIMIICSHSHSTPWAAGRLDLDALLSGVEQDKGLIQELEDKIFSLAVSASRTAFPAQIGFATAVCGKEAGVGGNRRDPDKGPCDPNVYTLSVKDADGDIRGIFVNYAVHPTVLHANNTLCSADYPGYIRRYLRGTYGQAEMVFGLGASGDQSTRYFRSGQTFDEAKRIGYALGAAAEKAVEGAVFTDDVEIAVGTVKYNPSLRNLPSSAEAKVKADADNAAYKELEERGTSYIELQNANVKRLGSEDMLGYALMKEKGVDMELVVDELPSEIQALRIGNMYMLGLPGEAFMGIADCIREDLGNTGLIINTLANGALPGYVYTSKDAELGGYEVDTSMLDSSAGDLMAELAVKLIKNL